MPSRDLTLMFAALAAVCEERVRARMAGAGHPDVRPVHGYVFQHLLTGPVRVTDLAELLGMTPQGASKVAAEMERIGYVTRRVSGDDQRVRAIELTPRGREAIEAGRAARLAVTEELLAGLPEPEPFLDDLADLSERTGALRDLMARRLKP
ncbi:MarR family winged helix-turn-helix transcriptional regulator [Herbidospora sp. RD11066]